MDENILRKLRYKRWFWDGQVNEGTFGGNFCAVNEVSKTPHETGAFNARVAGVVEPDDAALIANAPDLLDCLLRAQQLLRSLPNIPEGNETLFGNIAQVLLDIEEGAKQK